jgi:exopolysaccharide biosynthesis polyprenyl glycosylphosphotransferase
MLTIKEKKIIFAGSDVLQLGFSTLLAFGVVSLCSSVDFKELLQQLNWVVILGGLLLFSAYLNDCLDVTNINSGSRYLRRWVISWSITIGFYLLVFFLFGRSIATLEERASLPRLVPAIFAVIALVAVPVGRRGIMRIFQFGREKKACIVIGAGGSGRHFVEEVAESSGEWRIVGMLDDDQSKIGSTVSGVNVVGDCSKLLEMIEKHDVQEVVLAINREMKREVIDSLMVCFERGIDVLPVLVATERTLRRIPIYHLGDKWLPTTFWASSSMPLFFRAFKRSLDVSVSLVLLICALPLIVVAMIAIKVSSPGPLLYFQKRVGVKGRLFRIGKIRTMVQNAEQSGAQWAVQNDNRITPVGKFLRATRIDELPQLWNVLKGEMSLIGPRPERPEFIETLANEIPYYRARLSVKPGLTGWAQIMYKYGNSVDDARVKLEYDLYYIKNRSLILEVTIGLKTLKTILLMRGA